MNNKPNTIKPHFLPLMMIMGPMSRPRLFCSKCITFENCRWNGAIIASRVVTAFKEHMEFVAHCPEQEIGLGVPRDPIRVVDRTGTEYLLQPATGRDISDLMREYSSQLLDKLPEVDGFILKSQSPSCGIARVKLYQEIDQKGSRRMTKGFFGRAVLNWPDHGIVIDEGRLENQRLREDFLTRIFILARFRELRDDFSSHKLLDFHERHKLLFMAYDQAAMRDLGRLVGNQKALDQTSLLTQYRDSLIRVLSNPPTYHRHMNVLQHAFGYFKKDLTREEKQLFLATLDEYTRNVYPLSSCVLLLKSWIIRFGQEYLDRQFYFEPFPAPLMEQDQYQKKPAPR